MESKKFGTIRNILAKYKYLILVILLIGFIISRVQVVVLPVGEECYYDSTSVDDKYIVSTRPVLYVNPVPGDEKIESANPILNFFDITITDVSVKTKNPGVKYMNMYHHGSGGGRGRSMHYLFIVF